MIGVVLLAIVAAVSCPWLARSLRATSDAHALAGLFGEPDRERVVSRSAASVVARAEQCLRLDEFSRVLHSAAWAGTPVRFRRVGRDCDWLSGDRVWRVKLAGHCPRPVARLVVSDVTQTSTGVAVRGYQPLTRFTSLTLDVVDAAPR